MPTQAPIVILIHGYKYHPHQKLRDPQRSLFSFQATGHCRRVRSWPVGLGFTRHADAAGLCIGFGWPAYLPDLPSLLVARRSGFARVYDSAKMVGAQLADLISAIQALVPGRTVDVMAHSLGARVALAALPRLDEPPGRMILLGAAEFDARAREFLRAMRTERMPEIYNVTARFNDVYDALFETFAPRRHWRDRALGHGLGMALPNWLDLQLDHADVAGWVNDLGITLPHMDARLCHWGFYTGTGALDIYRAILRRHPGWDVASLARVQCLRGQEPRWSRLRPEPARLWPARPTALETDPVRA
jgi:pimeloyl-ACP methyl ester carboxylesterase